MDDGDLFGGLGAEPMAQKADSGKVKAAAAPKLTLPKTDITKPETYDASSIEVLHVD